jgi:hypothetical protein
MKLPRELSGLHLAELLCREFGYRKVHPIGSHIILETGQPRAHRLAIPNHSPLRLGTLNAILRAVANAQGIGKGAILTKSR